MFHISHQKIVYNQSYPDPHTENFFYLLISRLNVSVTCKSTEKTYYKKYFDDSKHINTADPEDQKKF